MGCCLAAALLISLGRRAWYAVLPGRAPQDLAFAPAARRPAPDLTATVPRVAQIRGSQAASRPSLRHSADDLRHSATPVRPTRRLAAPMAAALTLLAYVTVVTGLRAAGLLHQHHEPAVTWLARDVVWAGALAALLVVALRATPRDDLDAGARALAAAGATWTTLAVVDMHVFTLVGFGSPLGDVVFHGVGLAPLLVGLALRTPASLRPPSSPARTEQGVLS